MKELGRSQRIELFSGFLAGVTAVVAVLLSAIAMLTINAAAAYPSSAFLSTRFVLFLTLIGLGGIIVALGAYWHATRTTGLALILLWLATLLLLSLTIAGLFSIGIFVLPGALLATIAAVVGSREQVAVIRTRRGNRHAVP